MNENNQSIVSGLTAGENISTPPEIESCSHETLMSYENIFSYVVIELRRRNERRNNTHRPHRMAGQSELSVLTPEVVRNGLTGGETET